MAVNMVLVVNAVIACPIAWNDPSSSDMRLAWIAISAARTTMFWKGTAPSAALVLFAFFCFLFNIRDMLLEYGIVFQQYVTLGRLYQRKNGGIATSVWGRLLLEGSGRPVPGAQLYLTDLTGRWTEKARTDHDGRWQFANVYRRVADASSARLTAFHLTVQVRSRQLKFELSLGENIFPEFDIYIEDAMPSNCRGTSLKSP